METAHTSDTSCTGSASRGFAVHPISPASIVINANNITAFLVFIFFFAIFFPFSFQNVQKTRFVQNPAISDQKTACSLWLCTTRTSAGSFSREFFPIRFYQANMDLEYLREGREYSELPRSYVIFICTYDYIGADRPVYFFEKFDRQNCLQFGDEAYSIILNTPCSPHKVPESLKPLFEYINDPSKGVGDALVDHIDERVKKFNTHEWRRKHMTLQELMDRNYKEGLEQGLEQGRSDMKLSLARVMKGKGEPVEKIAEYTGLTAAEVEALFNS